MIWSNKVHRPTPQLKIEKQSVNIRASAKSKIMQENLSQKVLEKIKNEKISPKATWRFSLCRLAVFAFLIFFLAAGAISFGVVFDIIHEAEVARFIGRPRGLGLLFLSLPYLWIIFMAMFSGLAVADFARTRRGYRYRMRYVTIGLFGVMMLSGAALHVLGYCEKTEIFLESRLPFYNQVSSDPRDVWLRPEDGLLSGIVVRDDSEGCHCLELRDWRENVWNVDYGSARVVPQPENFNGQAVKIVGREGSDHDFEAEEIWFWRGRRAAMPFRGNRNE